MSEPIRPSQAQPKHRDNHFVSGPPTNEAMRELLKSGDHLSLASLEMVLRTYKNAPAVKRQAINVAADLTKNKPIEQREVARMGKIFGVDLLRTDLAHLAPPQDRFKPNRPPTQPLHQLTTATAARAPQTMDHELLRDMKQLIRNGMSLQRAFASTSHLGAKGTLYFLATIKPDTVAKHFSAEQIETLKTCAFNTFRIAVADAIKQAIHAASASSPGLSSKEQDDLDDLYRHINDGALIAEHTAEMFRVFSPAVDQVHKQFGIKPGSFADQAITEHLKAAQVLSSAERNTPKAIGKFLKKIPLPYLAVVAKIVIPGTRALLATADRLYIETGHKLGVTAPLALQQARKAEFDAKLDLLFEPLIQLTK